MNNEELVKYLEEIPRPEAPVTDRKDMLRVYAMNARKASKIGWLLICWPVLLMLVRIWWGPVETPIPLWLRGVLLYIFIVGFPFLALVLNLFSIIWIGYLPLRKEFMITVRMRWWNMLLVFISGALVTLVMIKIIWL